MNSLQSLEEIFSALKRRVVMMAVIVIVGCVASVFFALKQTKEYQATAVVQIEAPEVTESLTGAAAARNDAMQRVKLIEQRLMSRDNMAQVMEKHGLFSENASMSINERVGLLRGAVSIEQILTTAQSWMPGGVPSGLIINVRLNDPAKARDVANDLMYSVIESSRLRGVEAAQAGMELLTTEENRVATEIDELEAQIAAFKRENAGFLAAGITVLRDELGQLREGLTTLDRELVGLESGSTRRSAATDQKAAQLQEQKQVLNNRIAEIDTIIARSPAVERDLNQLQRELKRKQDQYSVITRRKAEAETAVLLEERQQGSRFEVLETALLPEYPVSRSRKSIAIMGGAASVMLAMGIALMLEFLNPAIRTPAQMERALGLQPVVAVPRLSTGGDRLRRKLLGVAGLGALLLAIPLAIKLFADKLGLGDLNLFQRGGGAIDGGR